MNVSELLRQEYIIADIKSKTKREVLIELSEVFPLEELEIDGDTMVNVLLEREKLGSTGIGGGIAIPHGKLEGLNQLILSFGRSKEGVEYDALDGKPVNLFFLLMAPENSAGQHLKALAKISRILKDDGFKKELIEADSPDAVYSIIEKKDKQFY